jgi:hypothetical protein
MANYQADPNWQRWAASLLNSIGASPSAANLDTLARWSGKEGTSAQNNWLATTQQASGASNFNSVGVKNYPTPDIGGQATAQTLQSGLYPTVLAMFHNNVPASQWTPQARYELDTWAHGPHGAHYTTYSNFLSGPSIAGQNRSAGVGSTAPGQDQSQTPDPFGLGSALSGLESSAGKAVKRYLYMGAGTLLMLLGVGILVLIAARGAAPAAARVAEVATPAGRVAGVAGAAVQRPQRGRGAARRQLSPQAQSAVAAAKAGRGSKLSPEVRAELRSQGKAA